MLAEELQAIADRAAGLGAERFVLDDGWFGRRDDDTTSLGDWVIDARTYPDGLGPLIEHVHGLGMNFGIWFEPEVVNPDSDLYRAHPDWALGRQQMVLGMARPAAIAEEQLAADGSRFVVFAGHADTSAQIAPRPLRLAGLSAGAMYRNDRERRDRMAGPLRGDRARRPGPVTRSGRDRLIHGLTLPWSFAQTLRVIEGTRP